MTPLPRPARWLLALPYLAGMGAWRLLVGLWRAWGIAMAGVEVRRVRRQERKKG